MSTRNAPPQEETSFTFAYRNPTHEPGYPMLSQYDIAYRYAISNVMFTKGSSDRPMYHNEILTFLSLIDRGMYPSYLTLLILIAPFDWNNASTYIEWHYCHNTIQYMKYVAISSNVGWGVYSNSTTAHRLSIRSHKSWLPIVKCYMPDQRIGKPHWLSMTTKVQSMKADGMVNAEGGWIILCSVRSDKGATSSE